MIFNNSKFGSDFIGRLKISPFHERGDEQTILPPPPPDTFFLLDNSEDPLLDNSSENLLVNL